MVGAIDLNLFLLPKSRLLRVDRPFSATRFRNRRNWWWSVTVSSAANDNSNGSGGGGGKGSTRLIRSIHGFQLKVIGRVKELSNNLPVKVFSFLAGFYCATAFATMIGQTGDWDVLSAAVTVALVEAIGALMYRASQTKKNLIAILNYWKAGLSLGLFLDSFKY